MKMKTNNTAIIAKEGWTPVGVSVLLFLIFMIIDADILGIAALLLTLFFIVAYRNPERELPYFQDASIVSPVDGTVKAIETVEEEGKQCYKITLFSSYTDVGLLRVPFDAKVVSIASQHGSQLGEESRLASLLNEKARIVFAHGNDQAVTVEHCSNKSITSLDIALQLDIEVHQGSRYGYMMRGSHNLYLPQNSRIAVKIGEEIKAGQSLIGYFSS